MRVRRDSCSRAQRANRAARPTRRRAPLGAASPSRPSGGQGRAARRRRRLSEVRRRRSNSRPRPFRQEVRRANGDLRSTLAGMRTTSRSPWRHPPRRHLRRRRWRVSHYRRRTACIRLCFEKNCGRSAVSSNPCASPSATGSPPVRRERPTPSRANSSTGLRRQCGNPHRLRQTQQTGQPRSGNYGNCPYRKCPRQ